MATRLELLFQNHKANDLYIGALLDTLIVCPFGILCWYFKFSLNRDPFFSLSLTSLPLLAT